MTDYLDLSPDHIAGYLRRHPNFLADFPDLALTLVMPREAGVATSLTNYQLEILREKNRSLSTRLRDLVTVAEENQALVGRVHQLALRLLRAASFRDTVLAIAASLREDFHTDLVRVCLTGMPRLALDEAWLIEVDAADASLAAFADVRAKHDPLCGRLRTDKLEFLFGEFAPDVPATRRREPGLRRRQRLRCPCCHGPIRHYRPCRACACWWSKTTSTTSKWHWNCSRTPRRWR